MKEGVDTQAGKLEEKLMEFAVNYSNEWIKKSNDISKATWMRDAIYTACHEGGMFIIKNL